jgi:hypothetical protein
MTNFKEHWRVEKTLGLLKHKIKLSGSRTDVGECVKYTMTGNQCTEAHPIRKSILAAAGLAMGGNIHGFGLLIDHHPPKEIVSIIPS